MKNSFFSLFRLPVIAAVAVAGLALSPTVEARDHHHGKGRHWNGHSHRDHHHHHRRHIQKRFCGSHRHHHSHLWRGYSYRLYRCPGHY